MSASIIDEVKTTKEIIFENALGSTAVSARVADEKWVPLEVIKERVLKLRDYIQSIPSEKLTPEITVIALRIDLVFGDVFQFSTIEKEKKR